MEKSSFIEIQKELNKSNVLQLPQLHISILRNIIIEPIELYLRYLAYETGFNAKVRFGEYDNIFQEAIENWNNLLRRKTDCILIFTKLDTLCWNLVRNYSALSTNQVAREIDRIKEFITSTLLSIRKQTDTMILWHSFELPVYPALGILDNQSPRGQQTLIGSLNEYLRISLQNQKNAYFVDLNLCLARLGFNQFYDVRYWHIGRAPFTREALQEIATEDFKFIRALRGKNRKCLVLDCDNTLWGGIVGEDGIDNIKIGRSYPGSAYWEFQQAILNLYNRGIILAICSKNNKADVLEVLEKHPDMVLRKKHFASLRINWNDKITNLKEISKELNIGLDSLVFVDDSKFETNMIKNYLPEIKTITLPEDPTAYYDLLGSCGLFDSLTFSREDRMRGEMYKAEVQRKQFRAQAINLEDYYRSLEMKVIIGKADSFSIPRIAQLTQRTNQFNLTTKRYSESDIKKFATTPNYDVLYLRLKDRFGDSGIVGAAILKHSNTQSTVDTFLLSCRVIGRGLEDAFLKECLELSRKRNQNRLKGIYSRTKKNSQVSDFYQKRGFKVQVQTDSQTEFIFSLNDPIPDFPAYFKSINIRTNGDKNGRKA